jgi:hypothetical protein
MMTLIRLSVSAALATFLGGCAFTPNVTVGYYLAQSKVSFKVIRTVACDADNNPVVANATTPTVTHSADRAQFIPIHLAGLRGTFSDTDVKFEFYEDGRLKSVNTTSLGQGEAILKTVVTIATAVAVLALDGGTKPYPDECAFIKSAGGAKPLTLTYEGVVDSSESTHKEQPILPDTTSKFYAEKLNEAIGHVCAVVEGTEASQVPATYEAQADDVLLKARQPALVQIKVMTGCVNDKQNFTTWQGKLPVAQFGTPYALPIPAPPMFGKQVFAVSFLESGALTSVQYAGNTGTGQILNVTSSALTALQGETTAQKAAEVKAEADLIAQHQRLIRCRADPKTCT